MKLIKIITAVVMSFGMMVAQPPGQGGNQDGNQGPPPFEDVDTNGDGSIDREEARAMFGHDEEGNADPNFDEEYDKIDTNGDGEVDHAEYMAADGGDHNDGNQN